jgi:hypothetical protein
MRKKTHVLHVMLCVASASCMTETGASSSEGEAAAHASVVLCTLRGPSFPDGIVVPQLHFLHPSCLAPSEVVHAWRDRDQDGTFNPVTRPSSRRFCLSATDRDLFYRQRGHSVFECEDDTDWSLVSDVHDDEASSVGYPPTVLCTIEGGAFDTSLRVPRAHAIHPSCLPPSESIYAWRDKDGDGTFNPLIASGSESFCVSASDRKTFYERPTEIVVRCDDDTFWSNAADYEDTERKPPPSNAY